jgi:hypothetical protein
MRTYSSEQVEETTSKLTDETLFSDCLNTHYEYFKANRRTGPINPEISLLLAILENGIQCYCKFLSDKTRRGQRLFKEAEEWFFNPNDDWFCSFENVCAVLLIDPGYVRRGLRHYQRTHDSSANRLNIYRRPRIVKRAA